MHGSVPQHHRQSGENETTERKGLKLFNDRKSNSVISLKAENNTFTTRGLE